MNAFALLGFYIPSETDYFIVSLIGAVLGRLLFRLRGSAAVQLAAVALPVLVSTIVNANLYPFHSYFAFLGGLGGVLLFGLSSKMYHRWTMSSV